MISMNASSIHSAVLAGALQPQSPPVADTDCSMPKPIDPVNPKYWELAAEEIDRVGLKVVGGARVTCFV